MHSCKKGWILCTLAQFSPKVTFCKTTVRIMMLIKYTYLIQISQLDLYSFLCELSSIQWYNTMLTHHHHSGVQQYSSNSTRILHDALS